MSDTATLKKAVDAVPLLPAATPAPATTRNQLTLDRAIKLRDWVRARADELAASPPRLEDLAAEAAKALGGRITAANIKYHLNAEGLTWAGQRHNNHSGNDIAHLSRELAEVRWVLASLLRKLGEPLPPGWNQAGPLFQRPV